MRSFPASAARPCGEPGALPANSKRRPATIRRYGEWRSRSGSWPAVLAAERDKIRTTRDIAIELHGALERLAAGGSRLEDGTRRLAGSASGLQDGLEQLSAGADRLAEGLAELHGGAGALERGLARRASIAPTRSSRGSARPRVRVSAAAGPLARGAAALRHRSPHLFDSGYFVLSALDGAPPVARALAGEAVNVEHGGQAARLLVVSTDPFNTPGSRATGRRAPAPKRSDWPGKAIWRRA